MWISTTKSTNDILQTLMNSRPGEIIAMEGAPTSGKDRMIELLVMDDETRRIHVMHQYDREVIINRDKVDPEPDVYVLSDLDQWHDISANQPALLRWISFVLRNDKTIIITGEGLHKHLPTLMDVFQAQYGDRFSLYQHKVDDLSLVNMNPYPFIQTGSLIKLGTFQRSIAHAIEPLFWSVIFRRGYMVWLLATESVGCLNCCCEGTEADWRHSPLRLWLNGQFLDGFADEERAAIMGNRSSGKEQSADGEEAPSVPGKVILPSVYEVEHFLPDRESRSLFSIRHRLTEEGVIVTESAPIDWWLRTDGREPGTAAYVRSDGGIDKEGKKASEYCAVRPLILVNLNRLPEKNAQDSNDELPL